MWLSGGGADGWVLAQGLGPPAELAYRAGKPLRVWFAHLLLPPSLSPSSPPPHPVRRSRVVSIKPPERSYHIFYQLCAGASEDQTASLGCVGFLFGGSSQKGLDGRCGGLLYGLCGVWRWYWQTVRRHQTVCRQQAS